MLQDSRLRFLIVGGFNTILDMGILLLMTHLGLGIFAANLISTSIALASSFLFNRRFTFRANGSKPIWLQAVQFLVVTLIGLWLLQPPIIAFVNDRVAYYSDLGPQLNLLIGKAVATVVTLVWNYLLYSRFVFNNKTPQNGSR